MMSKWARRWRYFATEPVSFVDFILFRWVRSMWLSGEQHHYEPFDTADYVWRITPEQPPFIGKPSRRTVTRDWVA